MSPSAENLIAKKGTSQVTTKKKKLSSPVIPSATTGLTLPPGTLAGGDSTGTTSTAPPKAIASTAAPTFTVPVPPATFVPGNLLAYRGSHLQAAQIAAMPDAILELQSFENYSQTFGAGVAPAAQIVSEVQVAIAWTATRTAVEALLVYAKTQEAITSKSSLADLDQLGIVFKAIAKQNPAIAGGCPALVRVFEARTASAQRGVATRKRRAKANAAKNATATSEARASNAATAPAVTSGSAAGPATTTVTPADVATTGVVLPNGATH